MMRADEIGRRQGAPPHKAVIAGGFKNHVRGTISENLASVGIEVVDHIESDRHRGPISAGADLVILLTDTASDVLIKHVRRECERQEVPLVEGSRKWARMAQALVRTRWIKPEALAAMRPAPDPLDTQESPVPDKPPASVVQMSVRTAPPETFEERAATLKALVGKLFDADGVVSLIATKTEGKVKIEIERSLRVTI